MTPLLRAADPNAAGHRELEVEQKMPAVEESPTKETGMRKRPATAAGSSKRRSAAAAPGARRAQRPSSAIAAATLAVSPETGPAIPTAASAPAPSNDSQSCLWNGCGTVLNGKAELEKHLNDDHLATGLLKAVTTDQPQRCLWNGCHRTAVFTKREHLVLHMVTHHRNPKFVCPVCNTRFTREGTRRFHLRKAKRCREQQQQHSLQSQQSQQSQPPPPPQN
jgi:hypothetical protein